MQTKSKNISAFLNSFNVSPNNKVILIIPLDGCSDCVQKPLNFVKENIHNKKFIYVLSCINKKEILFNLNTDTIPENVILDIKQNATTQKLVGRSPKVYIFGENYLKHVIDIGLVENKAELLQYLLTNNKNIIKFE